MGTIAQLLPLLAPVVMGMLGNRRRAARGRTTPRAIAPQPRTRSAIMPPVVEAHGTPTDRPARLAFGRELVRRVRDRVEAWVNDPGLALPALLLLSFVLRAAWIDKPPGGVIFDETYYVNASRVILGLPVAEGAHYAGSPAGLDPNIEHPPLGKVLIAGSMAIFGDGPLGWRLPSIIAALIAIAAVYLIVRASGETAALAFGIAGFVAFDNLTFVHGRIGDPGHARPRAHPRRRLAGPQGALAPGRRPCWPRVPREAQRPLRAAGDRRAAGVARPRAMAARPRDSRWPTPEQALSLVVGVAVVGLVGLWLLDLRFTTFTNPLDHVRHMVEYGAEPQGAGRPLRALRGRRERPLAVADQRVPDQLPERRLDRP